MELKEFFSVFCFHWQIYSGLFDKALQSLRGAEAASVTAPPLLSLVCRADVSGGLQVGFGAPPQPHLHQQHQPGGAGAGEQGRPKSPTFPSWTVHCVTHFKHTHTHTQISPSYQSCRAASLDVVLTEQGNHTTSSIGPRSSSGGGGWGGGAQQHPSASVHFSLIFFFFPVT